MKNTNYPLTYNQMSAGIGLAYNTMDHRVQGKNAGTTTHKSSAELGLHQLFETQLKDIYWAEQALVKAIPIMINHATSTELKSTLKTHLLETRQHINSCMDVFETIDKLPDTDVCEAMKSLIEEAKVLMNEFDSGPTRDAAIICAAQKIEHYEMATYGTLVSLAGFLGETEAEFILEEILDEEKNTNTILSELSMNIFKIDASKEAC
jgi:ferritin-like metal-binding protein YciE